MPEQDIPVTFQPSGKRTRIEPGSSLLDAARLCGVFIPSICGGKGRCGKCRVLVATPGALEPPTEAETELLGRDRSKRMRLACLARPKGRVTVEIPAESRRAAPEILVEGLDYEITIDPSVTKHYLEMSPPTLEDPLADFERVGGALSKGGVQMEEEGSRCLQHGPRILREAGWKVTAGIWESTRLVRLQPADTSRRAYGVAVDIGTTTLVCYLVDLLSGKTLAVDSALNPQIPYGEDVVTRLAFADMDRANAGRLHSLVVAEISRLISNCVKKAGVKRDDVLDVCLAGNTVMHHIALGLPTHNLGVSPFAPVIRRGLDTNARQVGLRLHPDTPVHALPTLAGFVGADTCAVILASRIYEAKETSMAIDIGTNGEVVLGDSSGLVVCSCAAGPALEGAHIRFGMRAAEGAIRSVKIEEENVRVDTIGDMPAVGIAGSGIIDSVAEMFRSGVIGPEGRFRDHPRVRKVDGMKEFVLVKGAESGIQSDIVMTQRDVREVQLAKAAIFTGASSLLQRSGKRPQDVAALYVAGAFGNYIDFHSAKTIGLIPDIPRDRLKFIGNGAAAGAKLALLSRSLREVSEHIAEKVDYLELTCAADFTRRYMDATHLPHRDPSEFPSERPGN
jgi:uncharacterized 2Fe-2S/4Fe-4S cluster protein (DUF4445 family)